MSFQADLYSSAWAHIALCADLTWSTESPDDFIIANQRLWAHHCRVLQDTIFESRSHQPNHCESDNKRTVQCQTQDNCNRASRSVKDVIPESRLAQYYGNFYYDELREKCYTDANDRSISRGQKGKGCESSDLTECWMLPEVEFWFRKLLNEPDRCMLPRRRRQYAILPDEDLEVNRYISAASEHWSPNGARVVDAEAVLAAKVHSVKALWTSHATRLPQTPMPRIPSPSQVSRKMRARRRQPRRFTALPPPPPVYCREVPTQLFCDRSCKFPFDSPRTSQLADCKRFMGECSCLLSVNAGMRGSVVRYPPYRGTNVSRYAPTGQRPTRYPDRRFVNPWNRNHLSPKCSHRFQLSDLQHLILTKIPNTIKQEQSKVKDNLREQQNVDSCDLNKSQKQDAEISETDRRESLKEESIEDDQVPATSAAAVVETGTRQKRLYSTVLSTSAPSPINLTPAVRLEEKLATPEILKLNPKIVLPSARIRPLNTDHKFEELEKEALEQYKASDESIDTKLQELENQAVEQYSTSNSNTSCSSGNSASKKRPANVAKEKQSAALQKEKPVDSVVIYSQKFPDLNTKGTSVLNLKNFQSPLRGGKKDHRSKNRLRNNTHRAASDTDNGVRECNGNLKSHKGPLRWTLHVIPPKKRHLTLCVSDYSSDEHIEENSGSIKDAVPRVKNHVGKLKMSAHGGGDLRQIMRKT